MYAKPTHTKPVKPTIEKITLELSASEAAMLFSLVGKCSPTDTKRAMVEGGLAVAQADKIMEFTTECYLALKCAFGVEYSIDTHHLI